MTDRLNANKPQASNDPKNPRAQVNNNKDLDVDKKDEPSFFGSFFASKTTSKKKGGVMEAPPPIIRPQSALNERETMETEVISACYRFHFSAPGC